MAPVPRPRASFEILSDTSSGEDGFSPQDSPQPNSPLRDLSVSHLQNRQPTTASSTTPAVDSLTARIRQLHLDTETQANDSPEWTTVGKNQGRRRLVRPVITANTFEVLETVPEDEPKPALKASATSVPHKTQGSHELSAEEYSDHPLCKAARHIPAAEEQLAKHREGRFEWVLTVRVPIQPASPRSDTSTTPKATAAPEVKEVHFGCNLLPIQREADQRDPREPATPLYTFLVSPLADGEELLDDGDGDSASLSQENMALAEPQPNHSTPAKEQGVPPEDGAQQTPPASAPAKDKERRAGIQPIARIEDSVEALDKLEEQLEAFDEVARFRQMLSPPGPDSARRSTMQSLSVKANDTGRPITPQPKQSTPTQPGSAAVGAKSDDEPRHRSVRKAASMIFLNPPRFASEERPAAQAPPKRSVGKGIASLLPPKQPVKSSKKPTIPTFELPGDEFARKLREKREARASAQAAMEQATKPTLSSLRRSKSVRAPTRPTFELPGEAISRRKREEREAQLRAQEEEDRRRREFKARPIGPPPAPGAPPRETVASRARHGKANTAENSPSQLAPGKHTPAAAHAGPRSPLSSASNASQTRGRGLRPADPVEGAGAGAQGSRGTSSSTSGSASAKRSSVSLEDVQQQRLRGQEIYKQDNSRTRDRERERREREALAKLAREEAAERSRQQSREWAARQARKRATVGSLRDVVA
ncbi:hypothetical protein GGS23DRAFT_620991 [Durotheca rogersii]|uniref:uncharacterized protein n=1 Tax=Durotheca rogersii TaxID=419775 RepID=UPI00221F88D0|nr:uncharacterized protein GGS23DRAFT_620991 [Durotheca rogersii]KAI5863355.1 hypothetical protein GGS23DRAFT_620991 [Durotheca rogersii]